MPKHLSQGITRRHAWCRSRLHGRTETRRRPVEVAMAAGARIAVVACVVLVLQPVQPQSGTAARLGGDTRTGSTLPPAPAVRIKRGGRDHVLIYYTFKTMPQARTLRPWLLLTSSDSRGTRFPQITVRTIIRSRSGRVRQPLLGASPYVIRVAAESKTGRRSVTVTRRVR